MRWKKNKELINKLKRIKIFNSTFYCRHSVRIVLVLIAVWIGIVLFLNRELLEQESSFKKLLLITQDIDSVRYLLSSAFQGLSALFALTLSISFVIAQIATSSYSPRLVIKILRKKWFIACIFLFIFTLSYNLYLLSFLDTKTIGSYKALLLLGNMLDLASIILIFPFAFRFVRSIEPNQLIRDLVEKFNSKYFEKMILKNEVDDSMPIFQSTILKGIENEDSDLIFLGLNGFFSQLNKIINPRNYNIVCSYFKPFFHKIVRKLIKKKEEDLIRQLFYHFESLQYKVVSPEIFKISQFNDYYSSSMVSLILFTIEELIVSGDSEVIDVGFGTLSRLEQKIIPLIPPDDQIPEIKMVKEIRQKNYKYRSDPKQYENNNIFKNIENFFVGEEILRLLKSAIKAKNERASSTIIGHIFQVRYTVMKLDSSKTEVKKRIFMFIPYRLQELLNLAFENGIDVVDDIISGVYESFDDFFNLDKIIARELVDLMCYSIKLQIEKEFFPKDPGLMIYTAGVAGRTVASRKNKDVKKMMKKIIDTFKEILEFIDKKSKNKIHLDKEEIRNTIASELKSFQNFGLREVDKKMSDNLEKFLVANWSQSFLKTLENKRK